MSNGDSETDCIYQMQLFKKVNYLQSLVELRASEIRAELVLAMMTTSY